MRCLQARLGGEKLSFEGVCGKVENYTRSQCLPPEQAQQK